MSHTANPKQIRDTLLFPSKAHKLISTSMSTDFNFLKVVGEKLRPREKFKVEGQKSRSGVNNLRSQMTKLRVESYGTNG